MARAHAASSFNFDVVIVGGGLAGMTLALLLAKQKRRIAVVERTPLSIQTKRNFDERTTAISAGSAEILTKAGIWPALRPRACPIHKIEILDGPIRTPGTWPVDLTFADAEPMGFIVDNLDLRQAQAVAVARARSITLLAPANVAAIDQDDDAVRVTLGDGRVARTALVVGADGRGSFVREAARIRTRGWPYDHTAIVATITHTGSHQNTAIEHFLSTGPFAVLPFTADARGRYRSAVVWSERPVTAQKIMAMSDTQFAQALTARLPDRYGAVVAVAMRAAYPLSLQHAERYIDTRLALVADAAHGIHPIAGQGLNIGLRDAATLADGLVGVDDCGDDAVLAAYQRARRADVTTMVAATDGLTGLFGLGLPGLRGVRRLGMRVIDRLPPLKNALVRHAMGV